MAEAPPKPDKLTSKAWVGTLNNFTTTDLRFDPAVVKYCIWAHEKETTDHLQFYIVLEKTARLSGLKKLAGLERAHFEIRKGTHEQARDYVMKVGEYADKAHTNIAGPWVFGVEPLGRGHRSDMDSDREQMKNGATLPQMFENSFGNTCRYLRAYERYIELNAKERKLDEPFKVCDKV